MTIFESDDIDTRRELWLLLDKLNPRQRLNMLQWCAESLASLHKGVGARATSASAGQDAHEIYWDVCHAMFQGLDVDSVMRKLTKLAKEKP